MSVFLAANDNVWYDDSPYHHIILGNFMKTISANVGLSAFHTYHCIRATCITISDQHDIEDRHIMSVSGHKSETSIKNYTRCSSEQEMFSDLRSCISPSPQEQPASIAESAQYVVYFKVCL